MAKGKSAWLETVRRVVAELASSDVAEFEVAQKEFRLRLRRNPAASPALSRAAQAGPAGMPIPAPFTGIFYRAPSPTSEPYVRDGDWVEAGATVGLIETMKIFNEVKTEQPGRIEKIVAAPGQLVHAGDTLVILAVGQQQEESGAGL